MIRFLIILILVLVTAVSGALLLLEDPGYVLFSYADFTVETTLSMLIMLVVAFFILGVVMIRVLRLTLFLPDQMHAWGQQHRKQRFQKYFYKGMRALAEGRWKKAEKLLVNSAKSSELPLMNYLSAARAAQHQGLLAKRDYYLQLASKCDKDAEFAAELTQAELQIAHGQQEQALASLNLLAEKDPTNLFIMEMLLSLYRKLGEWKSLKEKIPEFRKLGIISADEADKLEIEVAVELVRSIAGKQQDVNALEGCWETLNKKQKHNESVVQEYARQLLQLQAHAVTERVLRESIKRKWNKNLVYLYGQVKHEMPEQQLKFAESWSKSHGRDAIVNLSLGRICMLNRLWGKARIYLEKSVELGARSETYFELGALLEHLGDNDGAMLCYRNGLKLAVNDIDAHVPDFDDVDEAEVEQST